MDIRAVKKADNRVTIKRALISVADKDGLGLFIKKLSEIIPDLVMYSTGGTFRAIEEALNENERNNENIDAKKPRLVPVSEYTGQPEMEGGLVKTLDFKIYLGLLSETYNNAHDADFKRTGAFPIDLVVVNLYPFEETLSRKNVTPEDARGNIDIGGPCMLRAAAKNYLRVLPLCDPKDYDKLIKNLKENKGSTDLKTRFRFAKKAFHHTAEYDTTISQYLDGLSDNEIIGVYNLR